MVGKHRPTLVGALRATQKGLMDDWLKAANDPNEGTRNVHRIMAVKSAVDCILESLIYLVTVLELREEI